MRSRPIVRDTITTTVLTIVGRSVGFFIPFFIASWYGIKGETDAFFFVYNIILFLTNIFSIVIEMVVVPFVAEARALKKDIYSFVVGIFIFSSAILAGVSLLFIILGKPLINLVTSFSPEAMSLISSLMWEILPLLFLSTWSGLLAGTLNAYKAFQIPAASPMIRALVILGFTFLFKDTLGIHALAWGYVAGEACRLLILFGFFNRHCPRQAHLSWETLWNTKESVWQFFNTSFYMILGMTLVGLNPIIDRIMASWLGEGSISLIEYADKLFYLPTTLLSMGFLTVLLSHWSDKFYKQNDYTSMRTDIMKAIKLIMPVSVGITILLFLFRVNLVQYVYGRGNITPEKLVIISTLFGIYMLGVTPYVVGTVFSRSIIIQKNTKLLLKVSAIKNILNIALNLIFIYFIGTTGIVISSTVNNYVTVIFLGFCLKFQVQKS